MIRRLDNNQGLAQLLATYHANFGDWRKLFTEIDVVYDEVTGQFQPRPWHEHWPQVPQVWDAGPEAANTWGPIDPEMMAH